MIIPFENQYSGSRLTRAGAVSEMAAIAGAIKSVTVIALNVGSLGDFVFNIEKNGTPLFSGDGRITINSANKIASKTGLNIAAVLGDKLTLKLEAVGAGGLLAPVYCLVSFDDGVAAGSSALDDLTDVAITSPANNDFLQRKSGIFVNRTPAQVKADLDLSGTNSGDQTASNAGASGAGVFKQLAGANFQFRKLKAGANVAITENANDIEISASGDGGASALDDLSDVVITAPATGQVLKFNGANWVNGTDSTGSGGGSGGGGVSSLYPNFVSPGAISDYVRQDSNTVYNTITNISDGIRIEHSETSPSGSGSVVITKNLSNTATWTVTIGFRCNSTGGTYWNAGIYLLDSVNGKAKTFHVFPLYGRWYGSANLNFLDAYSSNVLSPALADELSDMLNRPVVFMRVTKIGSTLDFQVSFDNYIWRSVGSGSSSDFTTLIDKVGFISVGTPSGNKAFSELKHFSIT